MAHRKGREPIDMTIRTNIEKALDAAERLNPELNSFLSVERE